MASKPLSGLTALVTALAAHVLHISIGTASGDDRKITFTDFMNSIREATTSVKGFLSGTDKTKLDAVEASADVTDATNVDAAGAVMDSDYSDAEGFQRKTGAGAYVVHKSNLTATIDPAGTDNEDLGYAVGSLWINTANGKVFQLVDAAGGSPSAVWKDLTSGDATAILDADFSAGEGFMRKTGAGAYEAIKSNLTATVDPTADDNTDNGYSVGSVWINVTLDKVFQNVDATGGSPSAGVWKELSGAGGGISNIVEDTTPQLGGDLDAQGFTLTDHAIKVQAISAANWGGSPSFDYADGPVITATRELASTPSITNFPASGEAKVTFELTRGTGSPSGAPVTWTSVVDKWLGGAAPVLGDTAGDIDIIVVTTTDGGTTKLGTHLGTYS